MRALVLQGGGARGSYQIGAWKAFREMGITFDIVTGASVGSLNGALIAQDEFDIAFELWNNMQPGLVVNDDEKLMELLRGKFDLSQRGKYIDHIKQLISRKGLDTAPLRELVYKVVDEKKLRNSKIKLGLVTISITDREVKEVFVDEMPEGTIQDFLLASSNLPVFQSVELNGKKYLDGGFYDNLPINLAIKKGATEVVTVELFGITINSNFYKEEISLSRITPSEDLGNILDFSKRRARRNIALGYLDTLKSYGKLFGDKYYLVDFPAEENVEKALINTSLDDIRELSEMFGEKVSGSKRDFFEKIIPAVASLVASSSNSNYSELYLRCLEVLADLTKTERVKKYKYKDLVSKVTDAKKNVSLNFIELNDIPDILKRTTLIKASYIDDLIRKFVMTVDKNILNEQ